MRRVRGDVAREARDPRGSHPYDLLPLRPGSCEPAAPSQQGEALHLRLAARPLWTYAVAELSAPRVVGTLAYLRRRVVLDREDACLVSAPLFCPHATPVAVRPAIVRSSAPLGGARLQHIQKKGKGCNKGKGKHKKRR